MAHYLTPSKIGLLVLIELYIEEIIPKNAVLPVLSFITSNLVDRDTDNRSSSAGGPSTWAKAERTISLVASIGDFEKLLGSYPFLRGFPGRRLWDRFLGKMWDLNSLNAMHAFLASMSELLAKTPKELKQEAAERTPEPEAGISISRNSLFGAFIRRVGVELGRMQWHDTTELWKSFVQYRQPTAHYLRRKLPGFDRLGFDEVLTTGDGQEWDLEAVSTLTSIAYGDMLAGGHTKEPAISTHDVQTLVEFQVEQMQSTSQDLPAPRLH
jgi:anaphase-promoting complex subunit 5